MENDFSNFAANDVRAIHEKLAKCLALLFVKSPINSLVPLFSFSATTFFDRHFINYSQLGRAKAECTLALGERKSAFLRQR